MVSDYRFTPTWAVNPGTKQGPEPRVGNATLTGQWKPTTGLEVHLVMGTATTFGGGGLWGFEVPVLLAPDAVAFCRVRRPSTCVKSGIAVTAERARELAPEWPIGDVEPGQGGEWLFPFVVGTDGRMVPLGPTEPWTWAAYDELLITAPAEATTPVYRWGFSKSLTFVTFHQEG